MIIEMLLNNDIQKNIIQMTLQFQKEINIIKYIIKKIKLQSFHLHNISIK
jgi:hypothetical protein